MGIYRWWICLVLLMGVSTGCRRAEEPVSTPPDASVTAPLANNEELLAELIGFEWELPPNSYLWIMNEGVLAADIGLPLPLDAAETLVLERFTAEGYSIDESAGAPQITPDARSYVLVRGEQRLNVVLNGSSGTTAVGITAQ